MSIREDVVASAVTFLQDPQVATSPVENKLSFLRSKNLTQEEIDTAFARAGSPPPSQTQSVAAAPVQQQQQAPQPYYAPQQQPYGWPQQQQPPPPPKRDWRDWFIMATVLGGVGYGLYFISKRYLYPLVAPPTPEKLEQDKTSVDDQFEKAFATLEQVMKDTEALKTSEEERTEKLDKVLEELEAFMRDTKSAGRRQDDETDRLRDEMKTVKDLIPKSMSAQKDATDVKLREISNEVRSLKSLLTQRIGSSAPAPSASPAVPSNPMSNPLKSTTNGSNGTTNGHTVSSPAAPSAEPSTAATTPAVPSASVQDEGEAKKDEAAPAANKQDYMASLNGRSTPFGSAANKPKIPAWQLAANKDSSASSSS